MRSVGDRSQQRDARDRRPVGRAAGGDGLSGSSDAFASKFSAAGNALVFSTLLGGSSTETGRAIGVASDGSVYVTGQTASANFPNSWSECAAWWAT